MGPAVLPTVYSLYWPETRAVVEELWRERPHALYDRAWERTDERPDLGMLETWRRWSELDLKAFPFAYVTHGASEAIKDLLVPNNVHRLGLFHGEYEGYRAFAKAREISCVNYLRDDASLMDNDAMSAYFISDPSAIDGEHWKLLTDFLRWLHLNRPKVRVFLDVIYTGLVKDYAPINPSEHPNLEAVVFSLSKPFGLYRHRVGGVFSRKPIPSLEGNRWFNNAFSLELAMRMMRRYAVTQLPKRYEQAQRELVSSLIAKGDLPADTVPSNAVLLARSSTGDPSFARIPGSAYRYCLTPAFHQLKIPTELP